MNKYCAVAVSCNGSKRRPDLSFFCFSVKSDDRKKWEVFSKRVVKKFRRLIDPRIGSLHFRETDIAISISGRKNISLGCYPTIFDPTKAKIRNLKQPRRRRQQERHEFAYLIMKYSSFARFARAFFHFLTFRSLSRSFHDVK